MDTDQLVVKPLIVMYVPDWHAQYVALALLLIINEDPQVVHLSVFEEFDLYLPVAQPVHVCNVGESS
jgi:hypothetical protein